MEAATSNEPRVTLSQHMCWDKRFAVQEPQTLDLTKIMQHLFNEEIPQLVSLLKAVRKHHGSKYDKKLKKEVINYEALSWTIDSVIIIL